MNFQSALKALNKYGPIHMSNYNWLTYARTLVEQNLVVKEESFWLGKHKNFALDRPDIKKERTYQDCVRAELCADANYIILKVLVYDGDMVDGYPTTARCRFVLTLNEVSDEIISEVMKMLSQKASDAIDREDELIRKRRKKAQLRKMLKQLEK